MDSERWGSEDEPGDARPSGDADASGTGFQGSANPAGPGPRRVPAHYLGVEDVSALSEDEYLEALAQLIIRRIEDLGLE